jgi:hypothetical protein
MFEAGGLMATERDQEANHDRAFDAAARRFPQAEFTIRRLLRSSEAFREICEELAEAEAALARVPESLAALHEARQREWQELVDELVSELEKTLREV